MPMKPTKVMVCEEQRVVSEVVKGVCKCKIHQDEEPGSFDITVQGSQVRNREEDEKENDEAANSVDEPDRRNELDHVSETSQMGKEVELDDVNGLTHASAFEDSLNDLGKVNVGKVFEKEALLLLESSDTGGNEAVDKIGPDKSQTKKKAVDRPNESSNHSRPNERSNHSSQNHLRKEVSKGKETLKGKGKMGEKRKGGHCNQMQMGGFSGFVKNLSHKAVSSSKKGSKNVIFRPAVAALASLSSSHLGSSSGEGSLILKEAHATLQMGSLLGINYHGNEADALKMISDMELKDKGRIGGGIKDVV
ncbi:hypothetical protein LOK49_LG09G02784 [Camellia lanceoleosa]|uniref:Uncharacterized protein n=1 Tax=Camellia lanceoleosa TaxID=1840588 RepID=A0ACC0GE80_9ERIC|nr:hypothetical protein LOK49_LG09G02784 [Camellia lanceoleosa]